VSISSTLPGRKTDPLRQLLRLAVAGTAAAMVLSAGALLSLLAVRLAYAGRAYPGVSAAGVSLAGRSRAQIETVLTQRLTYPDSGLVVFRDGGRIWPTHPIELGVIIDIPGMAERALGVGRSGSLAQRLGTQVKAWAQAEAIPSIVLFDQRVAASYLQGLAAQVDRPTVEAALVLRGLTVEMIPGQIGRRLDISATLDDLVPVVTRFHDAALPLTILELPPEVLDASEQAAVASEILSQPLRLTAEGASPLTLEPEQLASMMRFSRPREAPQARIEVALDADLLAAFLGPLAPDLERPAENARFIFNDDTRQLDLLREAVIGRALDLPAGIQAINDGLNAGLHEIPLVFQSIQPEVGSEATAESAATPRMRAISGREQGPR